MFKDNHENTCLFINTCSFLQVQNKNIKTEITQRYKLDEFAKTHTNVLKPLNKWIERIEKAHWTNHSELKADFQDADYVTNSRYVFNLKGNNYRLIVVVVLFAGELNIRFAGTHSEYDKIQAKTN